MVAALLAGCNKKAEESTQPSETGSIVPGDAGNVVDVETLEDTGDTLTIYVWNDEWKDFFWQYMPGVDYTKVTDEDGNEKFPLEGKLGDLKVVFKQTPSTDGAYQKSLDDAIKNGDDMDLFLVEADYAKKYTIDGVALPLGELGITNEELADQFAYTQQVVTSDGVLYGSSWQTCGAGMIYNREIAKEVLGSDDPDTVQAAVSDWDKFEEVAGKMKDAGYLMTPRASTTYRVFSNNVSTPWVVDNKINLDESIKKWIDMSKRMVDAKQTKTGDLWNTEDAFNKNTTFCVFGPAWYFNFCMGYDESDDVESIAEKGGWGLCQGPQAHYWGGTWICVGANTDNIKTCSDVVKTMTLDKDVLKKLVEEQSQDCNSKELAAQYANDPNFGNKILGGQNPYAIFSKCIDQIDVSVMTENDQYFNEQIQLAMDEYFDGKLSYDDAYAQFEQKVKEKVPGLQ